MSPVVAKVNMGILVLYCTVELTWSANTQEFILYYKGGRYDVWELLGTNKPLSRQTKGSPYGEPSHPGLHSYLASVGGGISLNPVVYGTLKRLQKSKKNPPYPVAFRERRCNISINFNRGSKNAWCVMELFLHTPLLNRARNKEIEEVCGSVFIWHLWL